MNITCKNCQSVFRLDDKYIKETGTRVQCSRCRHIFRVYPPNTAQSLIEQVVKEIPQKTEADSASPVSEKKRDSLPKAEEKKPEPAKTPEKYVRYIPFKKKLIYVLGGIIFIISLIIIPIEIYRPISKLHQLIENAKNLISGVESALEPSELSKMNEFAMKTIFHFQDISYYSSWDDQLYSGLAFNMLLTEGKILEEEEVMKRIDYAEEFEDGFDYLRLQEIRQYWEGRFDRDPETLKILRKYKKIIRDAKNNAKTAGFEISYFMIMLDTGKAEGYFKDQIAFVLDNGPWWQLPTYIGQAFKIEGITWRDMALEGKTGFAHDPIRKIPWTNIDFLPRFNEDRFGTWFSVWMTIKKTEKFCNIVDIDFDASGVKKLMKQITMAVVSAIILLAVVIALIAKILSGLVTRPITELTKGAEEVSRGNYDYSVPVLKEDEFGELTKQFNLMTRGQKERINLEETLKKFLGEELVKMAAEKGLRLGGQKSDCTVMFTDFAGFSTITQKMTASEAVEVLNLYFDALIPIIKRYGGFPDKYIGDAIVALFGAPIPLEDHAERAVACAITMQHKMREINDKRREQVCFRITDEALDNLASKGVSEDFLKKLKAIRELTLLEYLKTEGVSGGVLDRLNTTKKEEFIGKGELLAGEYLNTVLNLICKKEEIATIVALILEYVREQERALFEMRIGLNSGEVLVGAIGCDEKLEYTSIGETTNLANRMEASCKVGHVAIAKGTYLRIKHIFFRGVNISATPEVVEVKGMGKVPVFRIYVNNLSVKKDMTSKTIKTFYIYEETDHLLKYNPEDIAGVRFDSIAKFL